MAKQKPKYVRICPKCNSLEIYQETPGDYKNIALGLPTLYKCKNCGFTNYVFPEIDLNEIQANKETKKVKK
jgi:DNA-directed RNA polymerase subunit RPC12/RpoP